jgi:WD40 repeat protein
VGDIVATSSTFGEVIRLWSTMTGQKLCSFEKSRACILTSLQISRSSKFITACDSNANMFIYRIPLETITEDLQTNDIALPQD